MSLGPAESQPGMQVQVAHVHCVKLHGQAVPDAQLEVSRQALAGSMEAVWKLAQGATSADAPKPPPTCWALPRASDAPGSQPMQASTEEVRLGSIQFQRNRVGMSDDNTLALLVAAWLKFSHEPGCGVTVNPSKVLLRRLGLASPLGVTVITAVYIIADCRAGLSQ